MSQGGDQTVIFWQFAFIACWILLPLVPAVLIYLIFPKTETNLGGPFSGLTLRSSGAFSAYFVVLLASYPVWSRQSEDLRTLMRPTWEIVGTVKLLGEDGREIPRSRGGAPLDISLEPKLVTLTGGDFEILVPEVDNKVPRILVNYEGFEDFSINPTAPPPGLDVEVDRDRHRIVFKTPLVIRRRACEGMRCPEGGG
jgi:hypothetical protein